MEKNKKGHGKTPHKSNTNLVQCKEGNRINDILIANAMNREIQRLTEKRFELANSAPAHASSL